MRPLNPFEDMLAAVRRERQWAILFMVVSAVLLMGLIIAALSRS
jgi:hypothetical protein